jgi:hypothetical protein
VRYYQAIYWLGTISGLGFVRTGVGVYVKRYPGGMSLWLYTFPEYDCDHYTLFTSRGDLVFSLSELRP